MTSTMLKAARKLAEANAISEPNIKTIYVFPSDEEVRLVEVDATALPSDQITPFYFSPDREGGVPFRSGIALIRPEEEGNVPPPAGWGTWDDAIKIWPKN